MLITMQYQSDIFITDELQLHYAELCNALYERELAQLASSTSTDAKRLKRRLNGLSYLIRRAARVMLQPQGPLQLDPHNASWQYKQGAKNPEAKVSVEQAQTWLQSNKAMGEVVPVSIQELGCEHVELDSIDRIDSDNHRLHLNKNGWFSLTGLAEQNTPLQQKRIVKPTKLILAAACCGHRWDHKGKSQPRTLTLREIMLTTSVKWR